MRILPFLLLVIFIGTSNLIAIDRFYGLQNDFAMESWPTPDGGLIVGGISISPTNVYSAWLLKVDSSGTVSWQKKFDSGTGTWINSVAATTGGDYIVAGVTGNSGSDAWIAKLESDGDIQWERKFGGADNEELHSVKQLTDGSYAATGYTCAPDGSPCKGVVTRLSTDGTILWLKTYDDTQGYGRIHTLEQPSGNELVCTGHSLASGYGAVWILRLDLNGAVLASTSYDYNTLFPSGSITLKTSDGRLIVGRVGVVAMIMKVDNSGGIQWQKMYTPAIDGGPWQYSFIYAAAQDGNNFILAGGIPAVPDSFIWVMKIDANGAVLWSKVHRIVAPTGFTHADNDEKKEFIFKKLSQKDMYPVMSFILTRPLLFM